MAKVPITVMGYRCERCGHEWVPRDFDSEPRVCPKCKSPYWNLPRRIKEAMMTYEIFKGKIEETLRTSEKPLTWTEIRTIAQLPQARPNNKWVRRLEQDIGLQRKPGTHSLIHWSLMP